MTIIAPKPDIGRRLAAVAAILTLAGAIALAVVGATQNWHGLLIALIGSLAIVIGGWYALTRRGASRYVGAALVVAGAGLIVYGAVAADVSVPRVVGIYLLSSASLVSARYALGKSDARPGPMATSSGSAPRPRHPVLIMNLKSGGGKAERFNLVDECTERGIEPVVLQPGDDLVELAEAAVARGADVIGMAGGDGSQALVATVAARHGIPHVVVPAGTRNHFALDLGLDRDDVVGALDAFIDGSELRVDLARVNDRIFVNNASLGLYAKIVQSPEYRDAKRQTTTSMLPDLLGPEARPLDLRFKGPDGTSYPTAHMILVSNDPYQLDRLAGRGTRERLDVGALGVVAVRIQSAADASRFVALEAAGQIRRFQGWLEWVTPRFELDSAAAVEIGLDGEALKMEPPLVFETMPAALHVRLPRHAIGLSPAARAVHLVSRSTMTDLLHVVAGSTVRPFGGGRPRTRS
jgi:diacylglycerol kinase family enzyme